MNPTTDYRTVTLTATELKEAANALVVLGNIAFTPALAWKIARIQKAVLAVVNPHEELRIKKCRAAAMTNPDGTPMIALDAAGNQNFVFRPDVRADTLAWLEELNRETATLTIPRLSIEHFAGATNEKKGPDLPASALTALGALLVEFGESEAAGEVVGSIPAAADG